MTGAPPPPPPSADEDRLPTVTDGLLLVLWTFLAQALVATAVVSVLLLQGRTQESLMEDPILLLSTALAAQPVVFLGVLAWLRLRNRLSWRVMGSVRAAGRHVAMGLGAGLAGLAIVLAYGLAMDQLVGPLPQPEQFVLQQITQGDAMTLVLGVSMAVIAAPLVEELVFRGVLFQGLRERLSVRSAIVLSAVLFALAHVELYAVGVTVGRLVNVGSLALLGAWLAGVFHLAKSLVVPAVAHAVFNGVVIVLSLLGA